MTIGEEQLGAAPSAPPAPPTGPIATDIELSTISECREVSAKDDREMLILAHLKAPADVSKSEAERPPLCITAVVDRSGSMAGEKLELCKKSLMFCFEQMRDCDEFGIISYDDYVKEELPLIKMDSAGKAVAIDAVAKIETGGSTNLSGGLFAGLAQQGCPIKDEPTSSRPRSARPYVQQRRSSPPPPAPVVNHIDRLNLLLGNTHAAIPTQGDKSSHDWTVYVKSADNTDLMQYIEKVKFDLHPTFNPPNVEITAAPFQVRRIGWGVFDVDVTVKVKQQFGGAQHKFVHTLQFDQDDANAALCIALPNQTTVASVTATVPPPAAVATATTATPRVGNPNSIPSVWLFTDGLANVGIQNPEELRGETVKRLQLLPKCTLFTFGFGSDHNAAMLKDLATAGSGVYYFVEKSDMIPESFADCLGGLTSVVAQNLKLNVELKNGATLVQLVTAYQHTTTPNSASITMRDMYSQEERDVVMQIRVSSGEVFPDQLIAHWTLEYVNIQQDGKISKCETQLHIGRPANAQPHDPPVLLDQQRNRIRCTEAMKLARQLGDANKLDEARKVIDDCIAAIEKSLSGADLQCQMLINDLKDSRAGLRDRHEYEAKGKYQMAWKESEHCQQRSACSDNYVNHSKAAMKCKSKK